MQRRERRSGWLLGLMAATIVLLVGFGLIYMNTVAGRFVEQSEQRDCATLRADIEALEESGQMTKAGERVTLSRRERYAQIGCEPVLPAPSFTIFTPPPASPSGGE